MTEPSLPELEAERDRLYAQLSTAGDFRRGSVSENYRKCGKPNCACAAAGHPGHGPVVSWDQVQQGAAGRSAGQWRRRERRCAARLPGTRSSRRPCPADRRGQREDLRGPGWAAGTQVSPVPGG